MSSLENFFHAVLKECVISEISLLITKILFSFSG